MSWRWAAERWWGRRFSLVDDDGRLAAWVRLGWSVAAVEVDGQELVLRRAPGMLPWVVLSDAVTGDVVAEVRGRGAEVSDGNTYRLGLRGYVRPRVEWMDAWGRVIVSSRRGWFSATPLEIEAEGRDWVALALLEFGICQLRRPLW